MAALNDVTDALTGWTESVDVDRLSAGSFVDGSWVSGGLSVVAIDAVPQNTKPNDLLVVPEGLRTSESLKVHTTSALLPVDEVGATNADVINYLGSKWRVYSVANRQVGGYYKAICIRLKL